MAFGRKYSDEQYAEAKALVEQGASMSEAARSTGIGYQSLRNHLRGRDPTPGGRRKHPAKKASATDEQLTDLFEKVASAPAIPMALWVHCDYCAAHFTTQGPHAAQKLVELSRDNPALRSVMEYVWRYAEEAAWAGLLATYFGVPLAHHVAPEYIYRWIAPVLNMPPRGEPESNGHVHPSEVAEMPTPFAGMDMESMLRMAESFGIKIELPDMNGENADTEVPTDAPDAADGANEADAASEAAETQASAPDSDAG